MTEFLAMGGYAVFVWPSYAVSALVLVGLVWLSRRAARRARARLAVLESETREP
jgi:heme exporter protein D